MILSLTIARTSLALTPLVISSDSFDDGFWLPEDGLTEPDFEFREHNAPESVYMPGQHGLAAVMDAGGLRATVYVRASSTVELTNRKNELKAALGQWKPTVSTSVDGVVTTYQTVSCSTPVWGQVDSGLAAAFMARADVTIPVNPT